MIAALLAGAVLGAAVWGVGWALVPPPRSRAVTVARLDLARAGTGRREPAAPPAGTADAVARLQRRAGHRLVGLLDRHGVGTGGVGRDLAIVGRSPEEHFGRLVTLAGGALLAVPLCAAAAAQLHAPVPLGLVAPVTLLLMVGLVAAAQHDLHRAAEGRRRQFRRALSEYEDRVAMALVGGTGLPEALPLAASVAPGWPFRLLEQALERARLAFGTDVWDEFTALGDRIGVVELRDLGSAAGLVGEEGARVAGTLTARAASLRRREIADFAGRAAERDSTTRVAITVLGFGFLALLVYPLVASFLAQ